MKLITKEWIEKAEGDHKVAMDQSVSDKPVYDAICFHAQQCAEKYLKAWLTEQGVGFPKTHDLESLAKLCFSTLPELDELLDELRLLTSFAVKFVILVYLPAKKIQNCVLILHTKCET